MSNRLSRLRARRNFRESVRDFEDLSSQTEQNIDRYIFKRIGHLAPLRRFVGGWVLLLVLLITGLVIQNLMLGNYFQTLKAVPGGIYNEGILGNFTNASPLYATSEVDSSVSQLVFAGLLGYNSKGTLVGDLASDYSADPKGAIYTVHLKPNLKWQDGKPLTSADVLFTYQAIQNPDAQSPLQASWRDIEIKAPDPRTVVFTLPSPLASFPFNLINGIVPQHILGNVPPSDLRSADFNTVKPVGAGPFSWQAIEVANNDAATAQSQIALKPFKDYQGGKPKLQSFVIHAFASQEQLFKAFRDHQLNALVGPDEIPKDLKTKKLTDYNFLLRAATMVFFKTTTGILADQKVRQALVESANTSAITHSLGYPTKAVHEPFLSGQFTYEKSLQQAPFNPVAAKKVLAEDGWKTGADGYRAKDGKPLTFSLTAADNAENRYVTRTLQRQWRAVGIQLKVELLASADFRTSLTTHSYEAILYGISIGEDPDVFVYWDSSQADVRSNTRLNLSEYKNTSADAALESGRTRIDPALRIVKYRPFLQAWQSDAPALGLYQPRVLYLTSGPVDGLHDASINRATDRYANVQNWQIRQAKVTN